MGRFETYIWKLMIIRAESHHTNLVARVRSRLQVSLKVLTCPGKILVDLGDDMPSYPHVSCSTWKSRNINMKNNFSKRWEEKVKDNSGPKFRIGEK